MLALQYLKSKQIDRSKWDACIQNDPEAELYAMSWWLDTVCPDWAAWIIGDYELCLPLPIKRRWGLSYLVRPYHTPHLAIYGPLSNNIEERERLWRALDQEVSFIRMAFREQPEHMQIGTNELQWQARQVLDLRNDYESLSSRFTSTVTKNLKRAQKANLNCCRDHLFSGSLLETSWRNFGYGSPQFIATFQSLLTQTQQRGQLLRYRVENPEGYLAAVGYFFISPSRVHLFTAIDPEFRSQGAGYALLDAFIRDHAQTETILDFGGSSIEGVAQFNKAWGAVDAPLVYIHKSTGIWRLLNLFR